MTYPFSRTFLFLYTKDIPWTWACSPPQFSHHPFYVSQPTALGSSSHFPQTSIYHLCLVPPSFHPSLKGSAVTCSWIRIWWWEAWFLEPKALTSLQTTDNALCWMSHNAVPHPPTSSSPDGNGSLKHSWTWWCRKFGSLLLLSLSCNCAATMPRFLKYP